MKVLVVGIGVIGSYLTHAVCGAGNDVTVVARGAWARTLREKGLVLHHYVQHATTVDHPRVVEAVPTGEHFDVAFSVMRQDQQMAALPELATIDCDLLVLVGNNLRAGEAQDELQAAWRGSGGGIATSNPSSTSAAGSSNAVDTTTSGPSRAASSATAANRIRRTPRLLFGFQSTAGNREADHVEVVRWGATGLDVGPLRGEPAQADKDLLARVFTGKYRPHWTHDFGDWLATHATAVLPMCYVSYICGCDLHQASNALLHRMVAAQAEGYALLERLGYQILPESDQKLFDGGPREAVWYGFCWLLAHTSIGTLCVDKHAMHAPDEMKALDDAFWKLRAEGDPDFPMLSWDALYNEMGGWDPVLARWAR